MTRKSRFLSGNYVAGGDRIQKARKPHTCDTCGKVIAEGDHYVLRIPGDKNPEAPYGHVCCDCLRVTP
jgi:ribosomal protein L34E